MFGVLRMLPEDRRLRRKTANLPHTYLPIRAELLCRVESTMPS